MSTKNVCFCQVIRKLFTGYSLLSRLMAPTRDWSLATPSTAPSAEEMVESGGELQSLLGRIGQSEKSMSDYFYCA